MRKRTLLLSITVASRQSSTSLTIDRVVRALYWHSRTGRAQDATVTGIVRLSFGLGYPVVEFVEQIVDLE